MSKSAESSSSKLPAIGAPVIEKLPGGEVKFSIRLEGPRDQVYLFAKKNEAVNLAKDGASGLHGSFEDHGDGTFTFYHVEPASTYTDGDKIAARFYAYTPASGQQRFPGPSDQDFTPTSFEYGDGLKSSTSVPPESSSPAQAGPAVPSTVLMSGLPAFLAAAPLPPFAVTCVDRATTPTTSSGSTSAPPAEQRKADVKPVFDKAIPVTIPSSKGVQKVTLIPLNPERFTTIQFVNNTGGKWKDEDVYVTVVCRDDRLAKKDKQGRRNPPGPLCYVQPDGSLKRISMGDNCTPKNERKCATKWSYKLTELKDGNGGFQLPDCLDSTRVYVSYGSPMFMQVVPSGCPADQGFGIAAPDHNNATDPNKDIFFDFFEFAQIRDAWCDYQLIMNANTSLVDGFCIPLTLSMFGNQPDGSVFFQGKVGMEKTRDEIYSAWMKEQPKEFHDLVEELHGTKYRINAPCMTKKGFGFNELNQPAPHFKYMNSYVDELWKQLASHPKSFIVPYEWKDWKVTIQVKGDRLEFATPGKTTFSIPKPTTRQIFLCDGDGVFQWGNTFEGAVTAKFSAALNRHVAHDPSLWEKHDSYYPKGRPANHYAGFWHRHNLDGKAYGFAYDDVAGTNPTLQLIGNPRGLVVGCGW